MAPRIKRAASFGKADKNFGSGTRPRGFPFSNQEQTNEPMKLTKRIKEVGAMGYILLWLIGVPIPVLFVIFLLRGCS
jgi:hypothetical protein